MILTIKRRNIPCGKCGTTGGRIYSGSRRPERRNTTRYGLPALCCWACTIELKREWRVRMGTISIAHTESGRIASMGRERREIPDRIAIVRQAKAEARTRLGRDWLTVEELDAVLPLGVGA